MMALSTDGGHSWQSPAIVPTELRAAERAYPSWSPVLHWDAPRERLLLFFTQSAACRRDTKTPTWDPGGAVYTTAASAAQVATRLDDRTATMRWSEPSLVLSQQHGAAVGARGIPKVCVCVLCASASQLPYGRTTPPQLQDAPLQQQTRLVWCVNTRVSKHDSSGGTLARK